MTREIKYRGKAPDGRWVYGSRVDISNPFVKAGIQCFILPDKALPQDVLLDKKTAAIQGFVLIDPETVGERWFTDKHDVDVYNGDIIKHDNPNAGYGDPRQRDYLFSVVPSWPEIGEDYDYWKSCCENGEVVGNRWDTPELVENKR